MIGRSFDPNHGDARIVTLVATVTSEQDAKNAALRHKAAWVDLERERELRELRSVMHNRSGVCG